MTPRTKKNPNKKVKQVRLPSKPSALIRLALSDLRKVEKDKRYKVNMRFWHLPISVRRCNVCLAGAVIAQTLEAFPQQSISPGLLPYSKRSRLRALDCFRQGHCGAAFTWLGLRKGDGKRFGRNICDYSRDSQSFHSDMSRLADDLEREGY